MDRRQATGIALVVLTALSFGSASVLSRPVYDTGLGWLGLVTWRFLIGSVLAWAWVAVSPARRSAVRHLDRRQLAVTIALGVLFTGNAGTYYAALETVPVGLASVIVYTYPVFVAILSIRFATRLPGVARGSRSHWRPSASSWPSAASTCRRRRRSTASSC